MVIAVVVVGIVGILVARHIGTAIGTAPDATLQSAPTSTACPTPTPNDCRDLIARTLKIDSTTLPTLAATKGLTYHGGEVLVPKDGSPPFVIFHSRRPASDRMSC